MRAIASFGLLVIGCAATAPTEPARPAVRADEPRADELRADPRADEPRVQSTGAGDFSVHEWGLIDVGVDGTFATRGAPGRSPPSSPLAAPAKPVIYVHLVDGVDELRLDLTAQITRGVIMEHWPLTEGTGESVTWSVTATRGACPGHRYPALTDPVCRLDFCEAAELARYETRDAACLVHRGERNNHLFYRGRGPASRLPLEVSSARGAGGVVTVRWRAGLPPRELHVLRVIRNAHDVRVVPAMLDARNPEVTLSRPPLRAPCSPPPRDRRGLSCDQVRGVEVGEATAGFDRVFATSGLTSAERAAFERAWGDELVRAGNGGVADAILYWLPEHAIDAVMPLTIDPAPRVVQRAHVVRVAIR